MCAGLSSSVFFFRLYCHWSFSVYGTSYMNRFSLSVGLCCCAALALGPYSLRASCSYSFMGYINSVLISSRVRQISRVLVFFHCTLPFHPTSCSGILPCTLLCAPPPCHAAFTFLCWANFRNPQASDSSYAWFLALHSSLPLKYVHCHSLSPAQLCASITRIPRSIKENMHRHPEHRMLLLLAEQYMDLGKFAQAAEHLHAILRCQPASHAAQEALNSALRGQVEATTQL